MSLDNPGTKKQHRVKQLLSEGIAELEAKQNARLDKIEEFVKKSLGEQGERSKVIHGFIVREVQYNIANQLWNMNVTMDAFLEVIQDHVKIEGFGEKLDAKKQEIQDRKQKEAEARMAERMQQEAAEKKEQPPVEEKKEESQTQVENQPSA